jgi:large subunit ribosomal protein L22
MREKMAGIQVQAVSKYVPMSPIKVRRIINAMRGRRAEEALQMLRLMPHAAAGAVAKTIKSAVSNADENYGLDPELLVITSIYADGGPTWKRRRFGARGRFKPILKRTAHITVVVEEEGEE